jgi:metallopeptidase MepB
MPPDRYQKPPQAPPSFKATPESLIIDAKKLNDIHRNMMDKMVEDVKFETATFENTVLPMALNKNESDLLSRVIGFYQAVSTDKGLRDASTEAGKLMNEFSIEAYMREDIYQLVEAAFQKGEKLDPESQLLLEHTRKIYIRNGLAIPAGPKRDRFKEIKKRLSHICTDFQKALNEENSGLWVTKEELEGVPKDVVEGLEKGTGEHEGKLKLSFKDPDYFPALKFALNSELRKKLFIGDENKVSYIDICSLIQVKRLNFEQCNDNVPLFREAIILRDEAARLVGYPDHASFQIEEKMAKTPKTVLDFLGDLRTRLAIGGAKEIEHLKELKMQDLISRGLEATYDGNFYLWDHRFYNRLMVENEYSIDEQKIAEYFPLQPTIEGMLQIFGELFGLVFVKIEGEERDKISETGKGADIVWHEDVKLFSVWDDEEEGGAFSGYLYFDLHPRLGKYGHGKHNFIYWIYL